MNRTQIGVAEPLAVEEPNEVRRSLVQMKAQVLRGRASRRIRVPEWRSSSGVGLEVWR